MAVITNAESDNETPPSPQDGLNFQPTPTSPDKSFQKISKILNAKNVWTSYSTNPNPTAFGIHDLVRPL